MQHERSQLLNDKDAIQIVYEDLVKTHNTLKEDHVRSTPSLLLASADNNSLCRRKLSPVSPKPRQEPPKLPLLPAPRRASAPIKSPRPRLIDYG